MFRCSLLSATSCPQTTDVETGDWQALHIHCRSEPSLCLAQQSRLLMTSFLCTSKTRRPIYHCTGRSGVAHKLQAMAHGTRLKKCRFCSQFPAASVVRELPNFRIQRIKFGLPLADMPATILARKRFLATMKVDEKLNLQNPPGTPHTTHNLRHAAVEYSK